MREVSAGQWIERGAMQQSRIRTSSFSLLSASRFTRQQPLLTLYLEGDGRAWVSRYRLSSDPTPLNPLALRLASIHSGSRAHDSIAWLGRPCQYQSLAGEGGGCDSRYWSSHRFSEEVVASMNHAVSQLMKRSGAKRVRLVGFSGGGAVAALLAARRNDVEGVVTVARQLQKVPQIHFTGGRDRVVPGEVVTRFIASGGADLCARKVTVDGAAHIVGWAEQWIRLMEIVETDSGCM